MVFLADKGSINEQEIWRYCITKTNTWHVAHHNLCYNPFKYQKKQRFQNNFKTVAKPKIKNNIFYYSYMLYSSSLLDDYIPEVENP